MHIVYILQERGLFDSTLLSAHSHYATCFIRFICAMIQLLLWFVARCMCIVYVMRTCLYCGPIVYSNNFRSVYFGLLSLHETKWMWTNKLKKSNNSNISIPMLEMCMSWQHPGLGHHLTPVKQHIPHSDLFTKS